MNDSSSLVDVKVGDKVMFTRYSQNEAPIPGTVVNVKRIWIGVRNDANKMDYFFRRDTQTDGRNIGSPSSPPCFWTMAQWETREREGKARTYLREQGIWIERNRRDTFWTPVLLADLIRAGREMVATSGDRGELERACAAIDAAEATFKESEQQQ